MRHILVHSMWSGNVFKLEVLEEGDDYYLARNVLGPPDDFTTYYKSGYKKINVLQSWWFSLIGWLR